MKETVYTPSSVKAKLSCAGFANDPKGSIPLEKGSMIHSMLEVGIENYDRNGSEYRGKYRPFTHEHNYQEYEDIASQFITDFPQYFTPEWQKEQEIDCVTPKGHKMSGIVDIMKIGSTSAVLADFKSGMTRLNTSSEHDMLQAIWYSYIVFKTNPNITDVRFTYLYVEGDDFNSIDFNINDLSNLESIIERFIFATKFTGLRVNNRCKWCKDKAICALLSKEAENFESKGVAKIKKIKNACEAHIKNIKADKLKEAEEAQEYKGFTKVNYYYIDKSELTKDELLELMKDNIKLTKKKALMFKDLGKKVTEKPSYRMK